jgi:FkbM family methyltransferase
VIGTLFSLYRRAPFWLRNAIGRSTWPLRLAMSPFSTIRIGGHSMRLDFMDNASFKYYSDRDRYEQAEINAFLGTVARNAGCVVIDVGANYGAFTLATAGALGRLGLVRKVIAIEPDPRAFAALCRSIALNGFERWIVPYRAIASDQPGEQTLFRNARSSADNRTHAVRTAPIPVRGTETVRAATIDELLEETDLSSAERFVVKMDIQGNECRALMGMERTLRSASGFVLFLEHFPFLIESAGVDLKNYLQFLASLGTDAIWEIEDERFARMSDFGAFEARTKELADMRARNLQGAGTNVVLVKGMSFIP